MGTQKRCFISRADIARRVQELAGEIIATTRATTW